MMLIDIFAILIAISIHEFAHAWMADRLGDPTPRLAGRLTLNPFAHLDPVGTLSLFLIGFGWGKPVPIDLYNLRHPRRDQALIALAGPASNLIFALFLGLTHRFFSWPTIVILPLLTVNLGLAFFNLFPFHPLDGAKIILGFLPFELAQEWEEILQSYSFPFLLVLLLPVVAGHSLVELILRPVINWILSLFL